MMVQQHIFTSGERVLVTNGAGDAGCTATVLECHGADWYDVLMPSKRVLCVPVANIQPMPPLAPVTHHD